MDTGNSLDFDWEKKKWRNWNEKGYNDFDKRVGWKKEDGEWIRYEELPMNLIGREGQRISKVGELPYYNNESAYRLVAVRIKESGIRRYGRLYGRREYVAVEFGTFLSSCRDL